MTVQAAASFGAVAASGGGQAWTSPAFALASDDARATISLTGGQLSQALTFDLPVGGIATPASGVGLRRVELLLEGFHGSAISDGQVGIQSVRLLESSATKGVAQTVAGAGSRVPYSATSVDSFVVSDGVADPLFGLGAGDAESWLANSTGTSQVELILADFAGVTEIPAPTTSIDWVGLAGEWYSSGDTVRIDPGRVERLLQGQMSGITDPLVVFPDRPNPKQATTPWARWVALDLFGMNRAHRAGEPDGAEWTAVLEIVAPRGVTAAGSRAIHKAAGTIRNALIQRTLDDRANTGHLVRIEDCRLPMDRASGRGLIPRSVTLELSGSAWRTFGNSLE